MTSPKRVCMYETGVNGSFGDYWVESPARHIDMSALGLRSWRNLLASGKNGYLRSSALWFQQYVDEMYRARDPVYMRVVDQFVERYADFDLLVFGVHCFIHPEVLVTRLPRPAKVLGFVDDPVSTYAHGIPCLWAVDGAYYISPGYSDAMGLDELLDRAGCRHRFWMPLAAPAPEPPQVDEAFFARRSVPTVYVGNRYTPKVNRLKAFKQAFGDDFRVHGRWPLRGWWGPLAALTGNMSFPHRVTSLTHEGRTALYWDSQIGLNMHWSQRPSETGNMRMYEVPLHGVMLLCDKAARDFHAQIFEPDREAVFYDSLEDAIDKARHYIAHPEERIEIARRGFERAWKDYRWETIFRRLLDWGTGLNSAHPVADNNTPT